MITKALLDVSLAGLGSHGKTSIFPCGIFQYSKDINGRPGTPNYDLYQLALKSTAKRLYPNYANYDWSSQAAWVKYDRDVKRDVIESLSDAERDALRARIRDDSSLAEFLMINEDLEPISEQMPIEIFSTMGK